jgi:hypothetical protein
VPVQPIGLNAGLEVQRADPCSRVNRVSCPVRTDVT